LKRDSAGSHRETFTARTRNPFTEFEICSQTTQI
jgi:hypothetical protein